LVARDLTKEQASALRIADNAIQELSRWNDPVLKTEVLKLQELGMNLEVLGFEQRQLDQLLAGTNALQDPGPTVPPAKPITRRGEMVHLGKHRILCGDSTNADDVKRLIDSAEIGH
jgi:hypothetical protein